MSRQFRRFNQISLKHNDIQCGTLAFLSSIGALAFCGSLLLPSFAGDAADLKRIGGWAWSPVIGWINHQNAIIDKSTKDKRGAFGVEKADDGTLTGWSWSEKAGWICWGTTCQDATLKTAESIQKYGDTTPPNNTLTRIDVEGANKGAVHGWVKLIGYKNRGWLCLSSATCKPNANPSWGVRYDEVKNEFSGWALGDEKKLGWIAFSGRTLYDTEYIPPGAQEEEKACARDVKEGKDACDKSVDFSDATAPTRWKTHYLGAWLQAIGGTVASPGGLVADSPPPFGVTPPLLERNSEFLIISGRSPQDNAAKSIVQFESACVKQVGKKLCKDFGLLKDGKHDQKEGALTFPPVKKGEVTIQRGETAIKRTKLKSRGASIDVDALTTAPAPGKEKNKYGKRLVVLSADGRGANDLKNALTAATTKEGTMYFIDGDLTIDGNGRGNLPSWFISNAGVVGDSGARTVVVRGTITIKRNIEYESTEVGMGIKNPRQLASVAWIALSKPDPSDPAKTVGGNIVIDPCIPPTTDPRLVVTVSGFFFAENQISTGSGKGADCGGNPPKDDKYRDEIARLELKARNPDCTLEDLSDQDKRECARIAVRIAALKDAKVDIPLAVYGAMVAKRFAFERRYGGMDAPSEQIINDGRTLLSIPPGLDDFFGAFPSF